MRRASIGWRSAIFVALAVGALSMLVLAPGAPAFAHNGERHEAAEQAPATATSTPSAAPAQSAPPMDASQIAWPSEDADSDSGMMEMHHDRPTTFAGRLIAWLGAWHPAIVHFPVALLLTAAFLELAAAMRGKPVYAASNKIILGLAVLSAFVAAPMGWADAGLPAPDDKWFLTWHRWIGTGLPVLLLLAWWLKRPPDEAAKKPSAPIYEVVLVLSVLVILAQAYLGGNITHGEDHLVF